MRNKNRSPFLGLFISALIIAGGLYVYFSATFERNAPIIEIKNNGYWNLKTPLQLTIKDESGIKAYKVTLKTTTDVISLEDERLITPKNEISVAIKPPRGTVGRKEKVVDIIVEAQDFSKWNFFNGNKSQKTYRLHIDKKRPQVSVVVNSYKISRGGSALVIFKASDDNLQELYIEGNHHKKFIPEHFYKDGYYISLLAWPVKDSNFKATIVAKDKAGNISKEYIPLWLKMKNYKVSSITVTDKFLKGKIADLAEQYAETEGVTDPLEEFKIINNEIRNKNEKLIHDLASKVNPETKISSFHINRMYPLRNGAVVAHFGDHRKYYYKGEYICDSYHMGLDLASNAMAAIKPQNSAIVVSTDFNGLYGNMPMLYHGLGLYTIYGHCSGIKVNVGDETRKNETIANTGKTGYAMGDHLHFGVLVQGIEVRPQEWMDKQWIKLNITDIIKSAKKIINRQ